MSMELVLDEVWSEVVGFIPKKEQRELAQRVVKIFEEHGDFVALELSEHPLLRAVSRELNDDEPEEEEDE